MMRLFGAALLFALLASPSFGEEMMRPGPEAEDGLKDVWRFVGAQWAPWTAHPRPLTKADAPLLEYAIRIANGRVEGPPPLSCAGATYTEGVQYHQEIFGGKLKDDKDFTIAKKLGLSDSEVDTERVICNGRTFDFYLTDSAQRMLGMGDVIYTLEQPTGMDTGDLKPGYSGPSFDCTQARATADRLICIDATLSRSDRKLGAEYAALKKSLTPESFATFQTGQRAWLAFVARICGANVPMPDDAGDRNTIIQCLQDKYDNRGRYLEGIGPARSGALLIEPRLRFRTRKSPSTEESDIYPVMSGGPQAAAFNAFIAKAMKLDKWRMDDKSLFEFDDVQDMQLYAERSFVTHRFDSRIVSLLLSTDDFTGGHGDWMGGSGLTWDMKTSRPVTLDDVFAKGAAWQRFVLAYATADLKRQTGGDDSLPVDLANAGLKGQLANNASWLWGKDKATVMFDLAIQGSLDDETLDVEIPYAKLKPYLRPDAPVLAQ